MHTITPTALVHDCSMHTFVLVQDCSMSAHAQINKCTITHLHWYIHDCMHIAAEPEAMAAGTDIDNLLGEGCRK